MDEKDADKRLMEPIAGDKHNGDTDLEAEPTAHTKIEVEQDDHLKIYLEFEDPETGSIEEKAYPDDTHIHDEHELAKPRITPKNRLQ